MNSAITSSAHPGPSQMADGVLGSHTDDQGRKKDEQPGNPTSSLAYSILDVPPWYLCIFLGIQHFLTALGGLVAVPLILAKDLCLQHDPLTQSYLISTIFFISGICTLLQVLFGVRLPILQGGTFAFVAPSLAMLSLPDWKCPEWTLNASQVNTSSPEFTEEWQKRIRELQGAIMVASCVQMLVGFSGLIGFLMRFIGPLTIAPTISLVALPLFDSVGNDAGIHWGISAMTIFLIVLFSQYLKNIVVPLPVYGREKCHTAKFYLFQVFPVLLALCISWLVCFVLTVTNALPTVPSAYGYLARTDTKGSVLSQAPWFRFPYPGQWGVPTVSLAGVFGIIAGVISSMVESVGGEQDGDCRRRLCAAPDGHVWEDRGCIRYHPNPRDWRHVPGHVWSHHCCGHLQSAVCGHELIQKPLCLWLLHLLWARHSQLGEQEPQDPPDRDPPAGPGHPGAAHHRHVCRWISGLCPGQHYPWKSGGARPPGVESIPGGV
ncbi:solute carrier family 23 member 2-like isoform X5 [Nycticebus coucang]|uniref:solute carrier family 23 member 2-like isoform X5 n=1 Tax=Nycticebus coucang TaxID=9470 RepID=UPI00234CC58E|nr:solute carrier family 23 member 2-like isoform X5 [Nycticebus coucang]